MRKHRGLAPEDRTFFDQERIGRLRQAVEDLSCLLQRGYAQKAATELVGNRYQLTARERHALLHAAWSGHSRKAPLPPEALRGRRLCIDGFNLLITLETALGGGILIRGRDGCYRDIANVHGNYSFRIETEKAVEMAADAIAALGVAEAVWYFDRPVSNSGRIARLVNRVAEARHLPMRTETVDQVDTRLKRCPDVAVTADAVILDSGVDWFDLAGWIIEHRIVTPLHLLDFSEGTR
ncbi:DUF434 domain-containing protein [Hydrogenimonas sp. SS33]|uniref:DUF434 domain-containing protein n=1 Tax=Hydrogenimonas leucolamina TaxID=2954236 RepID=UPI00336BC604